MKEIPLTKGHVAQVDEKNYAWLARFTWHAHVRPSGCVHACTWVRTPGGKRMAYMHRMILGLKFGDKRQGHHVNGDGRNNLEVNLRLANHRTNQQAICRKRRGSSSRFRGVSWCRLRRKWQVHIGVEGVPHYLGLFEFEEDAARARDKVALELFGPHAQLNFPT